jgi:hypothetical protein
VAPCKHSPLEFARRHRLREHVALQEFKTEIARKSGCVSTPSATQMREFSAAASARSHRLHDAFGHFLRVTEQHHCVVAIE